MPRWTDEDRQPLAKLRSRRGLSRNEASVMLRVGFNTLGRYETGVNDVPMGVAESMAMLYGVPFDEVRAAVAETKENIEEEKKIATPVRKNTQAIAVCKKAKKDKTSVSKETKAERGGSILDLMDAAEAKEAAARGKAKSEPVSTR